MINCIKSSTVLIFLLLAMYIGVSGQQRVSVGFYNAENLFDTIQSHFYDDRDFTPGGRNGWDSARYARKRTNLARVVDDAGFDVLGLAEVENEEVVRDLVMTLRDDYNYIHRTSGDSRGIDVAMIYKGDKFFPEHICQIRSSSTREFLHVRGALAGDTVNVLVCHMPSKFNSSKYRSRAMQRLAGVADSLLTNDAGAKLIIMGDFNAEPSEPIFTEAFGKEAGGHYYDCGLYGALFSFAQKGYGSYCWDGQWALYDNIIVSENFRAGDGLMLLRAGVFVRDYLLAGDADGGATVTGKSGYPLRTFSSGRYTGGFSDHLPVFAIFGR